MILAIDPGKSGAIAHLHDDGRYCCVEDAPSIGSTVCPELLANLIRRLAFDGQSSQVRVVMEQVASMPKQGVVSTFNFGTSYGIALGVVAALRLPLELVRPNVWKREMGLGKDKEASRAKCLHLVPEASEMLKRKKDSDRAEAILLGLWLVRRLQVQHDPEKAKVA